MILLAPLGGLRKGAGQDSHSEGSIQKGTHATVVISPALIKIVRTSSAMLNQAFLNQMNFEQHTRQACTLALSSAPAD